MNLHLKTLEYEKMILRLLRFLKIMLIRRTINIISWKAYLRNSYYKRMNRFRMSSECFRRFPIGFVDSIQVCPTQQWLISEISFGIWQARIATRLYALGMRLVIQIQVGLEDSNPKAILKFNSSACDYKQCIIAYLNM